MNRIRVNTIGMNTLVLGILMNTSTDITSNAKYIKQDEALTSTEANGTSIALTSTESDGTSVALVSYRKVVAE